MVSYSNIIIERFDSTYGGPVMANGGSIASRGLIFQAVAALIECLDPDSDWDQIKNEPNTKEDKVDIILYKNGKPEYSIQVKSSINAFERSDVAKWLESLRNDTQENAKVFLYLVGDNFTPSCERFIKENNSEIKAISFKNLQSISSKKLVEYIRSKGASFFREEDHKFISETLFAKLVTNSISEEPVSRKEFEEQFQKALPVHIIPKCLASVPVVNHAVGLIGRDEIKKAVRDMLEENTRMALVSGLGGIGKTAVMQHVWCDLKNEGKYVAWIECGESLKDDLLLLRTALGVPDTDDVDTAYAKIILELKSNRQLAGNLYLFLDNLSRVLSDEEQETLNGLNIHVMATSRFEHGYFVNLPLDVLAEESALNMFYGYYLERQKDKTRRFADAAREIVESVQSHTLLVELLAKAAWKKGGTLEEFRDDLKKQGVFDVFKRNLRTKRDMSWTIEEYVMELYRISGLAPAQQHIMKLFTIFTPEKEIYYKIGEWADLDMYAMDELVELGWLERGGLEVGYHVHQIIRDSIARQMEKSREEVRLEEYGVLLDKIIDTDCYVGRKITYEKVRERLVLTEDIARFFNECGRKDSDAGALFNNLAFVYFEQGNYGKAMEYYGKALAIEENVMGKNHPNTATTYNNLAGVYHEQGNYDKALEFHKQALAIREDVLGKNHPDTATTYNNMAVVYKDQGKYQASLEYFGKALVIREEVLGRDHPDTATTYNNMASIYANQGNYGKALEYFEKALVIHEEVLGKDHPGTATTYNNIALVYADQGNYDKALIYYRKALSIRENVLGKDHPDTATAYNNIAGVYYKQGNYDKALVYYRKALGIRENTLGKDHPDTATSYNNIANVYQDQGNIDKALEYYAKALVIREKILGKNHPSTAATYNNMADVYRDCGNYDKALEYFSKTLRIRENVLGKDHPDTATTYNNIATVYHKKRNYNKALAFYEKALTILEEVLGKDHPDTATTYNNMAGVYRAKRDYKKALEYYKIANHVRLSVLGEYHPYTQDTTLSVQIMELLLMTGTNEDELLEILKNQSKE